VGNTFGEAFIKSQIGAGTRIPRATDEVKTVFMTVKNNDKPRAVKVAKALLDMGFDLVATGGTQAAISAAGLPCGVVNKVAQGRPHIVDSIKNNQICLVINTVEEKRNASSLLGRVTTFTTIAAAEAAVAGMKYLESLGVISVQDMHGRLVK
jgi:carbamoyl-phosphate synthase large subunit